MKRLRSVVWSEGMFLTPHHFQAQDRSIYANIQFRSVISNFENWGLTELVIDRDSLAIGVFTIARCSGVFPDGLAFSIPDADEVPKGRPVESHFPQGQPLLDVFLGIRQENSHGKQVWLPGQTETNHELLDSPRFLAKTEPIPDENYGPDFLADDLKPVDFAKRNFRVLFGSEKLDGFTLLRIAQVARGAAGGYALNTPYMAPCLDISANENLMSLLKSRIDKLAGQRKTIDDRRRPGVGLLGFQNAQDLWLLSAIDSHLPALNHIWQTRHGHPEAPYLLLLHLAGALCSLTAGADPLQLPVYRHKDLGSCFKALDERIEELLQVFSQTKCVDVPLTKTGVFWMGSLASEHYFRNSHFFLAVRAQMGVPDLITEVPGQTKIGSQVKVQLLYENYLPGVALSHDPHPPPTIPVRSDSQYFRLNQSGPLWEEIRSVKNIGIYIDQSITAASLQLLIAFD